MSKIIHSPYTVINTPKRNPGLQRIGFIPFGGPLCGVFHIRDIIVGPFHWGISQDCGSPFTPFGGPYFIYFHKWGILQHYCAFQTCVSYIFHISSFGGWDSACFSTKPHSAPRLAGGPASGHEAQHSPGTSGSIL